MDRGLSRREFVQWAPGAGVACWALAGLSPRPGYGTEPSTERDPTPSGFPRQGDSLVREMVGAAHFNEERVRELADRHPALVNAWWDWGFGDWESPLGAASHVGRREIAEFLIERGARIDLFAAAMLGLTEVVKAFVAARPGVQRTLGPHGFTLLAHARAGGEPAAETLSYLQSLGDADRGPAVLSLTDGQRETYVGRYRFGPAPDEVLEVFIKKGQLAIRRGSDSSRTMHFVGGHDFFPAGAPSVRLRFEVGEATAQRLTVIDHKPLVAATRVPG